MIHIREYEGFSVFYMIYCLLRTRIFYKNARLIRFPIDLRNRKNIFWGKGFTTGKNCRLEVVSLKKDSKMEIGKNVQINDNVHIVCGKKVTIGNDVLIASKVFISDCSHGKYTKGNSSSPNVSPKERELSFNPVVIEDKVWLCDNVVILPGVHIGSGAVIGASSVVLSNIPSNCVAVGIPARVVKIFNEDNHEWIPYNEVVKK